MAARNVPKVLRNGPFYAVRAGHLWADALRAALALRACTEVRKGLQEPGKGRHLELTMARSGGGEAGVGRARSRGASCPVFSKRRLGQREGSHSETLLPLQNPPQPPAPVPPPPDLLGSGSR